MMFLPGVKDDEFNESVGHHIRLCEPTLIPICDLTACERKEEEPVCSPDALQCVREQNRLSSACPYAVMTVFIRQVLSAPS